MFKRCFVLVLLIFIHQSECRRSLGGSSRRTNSGGGYRPPTSGHPYGTGGTSGTNHHPVTSGGGSHDTFQQSHGYQTGNSNPLAPSAPHAPSPVGFESYNQRPPPQNTHGDIGFENVQHRVPATSNNPSQPIGFNVHPNNQPGHPIAPNLPSSAGTGHRPVGFNVSSHGGHPTHSIGSNFSSVGSGHQPTGFNVSSHNQATYPLGSNPPSSGYPGLGGAPNAGYYPGGSGIYPTNGQFGTNTAFNPHQQGGGYYNPSLTQPGSYYHPHAGVPNGVQPQIYQPVPVQQSGSGVGSLLGYAGSFAGGLLIGKLTSGGHSSSDDQRYVVHHYYHNSEAVPKNISVSNSSIVTCSQNDTQGLCVPNSFPLCLQNGTIMCVTHIPYTVPCGLNTSTACIVTVLPCINGTNGTSSCNTTANSTNTAVYIPCISNVTLTESKNLTNTVVPPPDAASNQALIGNRVELCVTAIAEPNKTAIAELKKTESPMGNHAELPTKVSTDTSKSSKGQGYRPGSASAWAYILIFLLWVGTV